MHQITLKNVRTYSHHGCLDQETVIGSEYRVDLSIGADLTVSAKSDALKDTVDYVSLNKIIKDEMAIPSKLLEHVAQRINSKILAQHKLVDWSRVEVAKVNPPIGGDVESVSVVMESRR